MHCRFRSQVAGQVASVMAAKVHLTSCLTLRCMANSQLTNAATRRRRKKKSGAAARRGEWRQRAHVHRASPGPAQRNRPIHILFAPRSRPRGQLSNPHGPDGSGSHAIHDRRVLPPAAAVLRLQVGVARRHARRRRQPRAGRAGRVRRAGARPEAAVRPRPGVAAPGLRGARGRVDPGNLAPLRGVRRRRRARAPRRPPGQRRRRALPEQSRRCRAGIMYAPDDASDEQAPLLKSNMFSLGGAKFFGAVNRSINLGGQSALALRLLLAVFSSKISSGANRPFGDEFRAARRVSEDIGAQLVLGDRPIEITLERALKSLSWDEKTKLVISLFRGITSTTDTPQDEKAAVSPYELYEKLSSSYPSLLQPLIHERDMFLAWSLKRSKAVNKSKAVVGVIGKGHMNGVVYALISDQGDLRFRDLVGRASSDTWVTSLIKGLVRDTVIGVALWALYEQLQAVL